ncbi:hypothetical protein [Streptomyces sp. NPDC050535]|uniref:hypothetical protein n=1 Tax=Streptomyces sp. NPDC050535 TaxID=3365626 RepID=UPI0037A85301
MVLDTAAARAVAHLDGDGVLIADETGDGQADGEVSVLLARRHRYTLAVSYHRCWSPTPVSLAGSVGVVCLRWENEEDLQAAQQAIGLDKGQGTSRTSRHHWTSVALAVDAFRGHQLGHRARCPRLVKPC